MSMPSIIQQSFQINLQVMGICYLYPPKKQSTFYKIQSYVIYFLCVIPIPTLGILYLVLSDNLDMERVSYNAGFLAQTTCFVTKLFPFIARGHRIRKCIDFFDLPIFKLTKEEHRVAMNECIRICRRNTKIMLVSCIVAVTNWATEPLFGKIRRLPIDVWLPFNPTENLFVYAFIYVVAVAGVYFCAFAMAAIDPIIGGLAYHATTQVKILKNNLQHLGKDADEQVDKENIGDVFERRWFKNKILYNKIRKCVDHHEAILKFVSEYESSFSMSVFSQFTSSVFVICFVCLQLSQASSFDIHLFQSICYLCVILAQVYFYCYYGSALFEESNTLTTSVYMSEWYDFDIPSKKALVSIMLRSQKPMIVTAEKIVDISLVTFATILRRSYSLIAVLKNFQ